MKCLRPVLVGLLVCASVPAFADQFATSLGGPSSGVVVERRVGTSGSTNVPVDENNPLPVTVTSGSATRVIVPLDVATVTTGGTAVTALTAAHRSAGGFIQNPGSVSLCINEVGTASGTTSAGNTTCIAQGQTYNLSPTAGGVSVISSDSAHPFSGYGLQ